VFQVYPICLPHANSKSVFWNNHPQNGYIEIGNSDPA